MKSHNLLPLVFFLALLSGLRCEAPEEEPEVPNDVSMDKAVSLQKLKDHLEAIKAGDGFEEEYKSIPEGKQKPWTIAEKEENKEKHRYEELMAYDETRVVLSPLPDDEHSDYINANWIDGYKKRRAFIATQGPLDNTVNDFWRMIWQENVKAIVMAVNVWEHGKQKCAHYWPNTTDTYGDLKITLKREHKFVYFTFRIFRVEKGDEIRQIRHFHFTGWPDMAVPEYPLSLVALLQNVKFFQKSCDPVVIHCSAGIGRTGTILLLHNAIEMAMAEGKVDVHALLTRLREQRVSVVETVPQYTLIYETLAEIFFGEPHNSTAAIEE